MFSNFIIESGFNKGSERAKRLLNVIIINTAAKKPYFNGHPTPISSMSYEVKLENYITQLKYQLAMYVLIS